MLIVSFSWQQVKAGLVRGVGGAGAAEAPPLEEPADEKGEEPGTEDEQRNDEEDADARSLISWQIVAGTCIGLLQRSAVCDVQNTL